MSNFSDIKRYLIFDGIVIFLLLVIAEISLRIFAPEYTFQLYNNEYTAGHLIALNAEGYRGPLVAQEKKPNELRLLALGDSLTFGTGVAYSAIWPNQLQNLLQVDNPHPVTVFNGAMQGESLKQMEYEILNEWKQNFDRYILLVSGDMISLAWINRDKPPEKLTNEFLEYAKKASWWMRLKRFLGSLPSYSSTYTFLKDTIENMLYWIGIINHNIVPKEPFGPMLSYGWRQLNLDPGIPEEAWKAFEKDLITLKSTIESLKAKFLVVSAPPRFFISSSVWDNQKNVPFERLTIQPGIRLKAICERLGIEYLNAIDSLRSQRKSILVNQGKYEPLYILNDSLHFSPAGHEAIARGIYSKIKE